jgi:hypothetical protein
MLQRGETDMDGAPPNDPELREALERLAQIGERNAARYPDLTSDELLDELEAYEEVQRRPGNPQPPWTPA